MSDKQTIARLSRLVASVHQVDIPTMPQMPPEMLARFKELVPYQQAWELWREQFQAQLNKSLSAPERSPQPTTEQSTE